MLTQPGADVTGTPQACRRTQVAPAALPATRSRDSRADASRDRPGRRAGLDGSEIRDDAGGDSDSWGLGVASGDRLLDALPLAAGGRELLGVRERRVELLARRGALQAPVFEPFGEAERFSTRAC